MIAASVSAQNLVINEMMSANAGYLLDSDGDASDWIELHNTTDGILSLSGYFLSDKVDQLELWALPDTTIGSGGFLVIFASGKDRSHPGEELHTNFSIKSAGEELFLTRQGMIQHFMPAVDLQVNTSYGMQPDGEYPFIVFITPTPGQPNSLGLPAAKVGVNIPGGIYAQPFEITFTSSLPGTRIFYTVDGNTPTVNSLLYDTTLLLSKALYSQANISQIQVTWDEQHNPPNTKNVPRAITIRAAAFDSLNRRISPVETNTYFIGTMGNNHHGLPVISICAEHADLFDYETGIFVPGINWNPDFFDWSGNYHMIGRAWERTVSVEFYENDNRGFRQEAGLRIHGGHTRGLPQKPLRLYARSEYGEASFDYPLFGNEGLPEYKRFAMKPFHASWGQAGFNDHLSNIIAGETEADGVRSRPAVLYINGEYWGIYFIHERIDNHLLGALHQIDPDSINIIENWFGLVQAGSNEDFLQLYDFIKQNDLSLSFNYQIVEEWMDIGNFIDYLLFQFYSANHDWPANNMKCWKPLREGTKWRWIFFDGDAGLDKTEFDPFTHNTNTGNDPWPTNAHSTLFYRKLIENDSFRIRFFNRMEFLLNHTFTYDHLQPHLNAIVSELYHEIHRQSDRYAYPTSQSKWSDEVMKCDFFLLARPCELGKLVQQVYDIKIEIPNCSPEKVNLTNLLIYPNPHRGDFGLKLESSSLGKARIVITTVTGQQVYSDETFLINGPNLFRISDPTLPDGVLIISVITNSSVATYKMLCRRSP